MNYQRVYELIKICANKYRSGEYQYDFECAEDICEIVDITESGLETKEPTTQTKIQNGE